MKIHYKKKIKSILFEYQKIMFYIGQASGEFGKPLRFMSEFILIILWLKTFGIDLTFGQQAIIYLVLMCIAATIGFILLRLGILKFNTRLSNTHNLEIQKILKKLEKIERKLK